MDAAASLREAILENLRARTWRAGHRIPTERALSDQFGLSRSAVRRVLLDFKRKRLITQTVGSGTYVAERVHEALSDLAPGGAVQAVSPAELMSARLVLEPALVEMAIGNATQADFERMDECLTRGARAGSVAEFEQWDAALHQAIAQATHNSFVIRVLDSINAVREQAEWGRLKQRSLTPERRATYQLEHKRLVDALKKRDGEEARRRLAEHLRQVRRNLLDY